MDPSSFNEPLYGKLPHPMERFVHHIPLNGSIEPLLQSLRTMLELHFHFRLSDGEMFKVIDPRFSYMLVFA